MAQEARDAISALRRSHDELVTIVEGLDPDGLARQSGATEWTVAQVLSHLGSAAEIGVNMLAVGKNDMAAAPAIWDRWNAMAPDDQAAGFVIADRRLVETLEALDDDALANRKLDLGFLPFPVDIAFYMGMRLGEVGLHRWDIEVVFDQGAAVAAYVVPFVLAQLPMFAGFFAKPTGQSGRIAIETTEPSHGYILELGEDGASLREGREDDAATRLALGGETFIRLTSGRLDPDHTPATVTVHGDLSLDDLRRLFPGY
jgi:uncharacterized protein (TIGR03083 family)